MRSPKLVLLALILVSTGSSAGPPPTPEKAPTPRQLLGSAYPIEVTVSFHTSLLHWLDSLAYLDGPGFTGGKTKEAHRMEFVRAHGEPTSKDVSMLDQFRSTRLAYARMPTVTDRDGLTLAFFRATSLDDALEDARRLLDGDTAGTFAEAVRHFEPHYRVIWRDGRIPKNFLERAEGSR